MTDASALDEALSQGQRYRPGGVCWFTKLTPDIQAVLNKHFAGSLSDRTLSILARTAGMDISKNQISYHRRKSCACWMTSTPS